MQQEKINKMRACSVFLPEPGCEVMLECLDEIERLRASLEKYRGQVNQFGEHSAARDLDV